MRLPRWLVIGMLTTSVLFPLAAIGWWWVTWPERTAREFVDLLIEEKYEKLAEAFGTEPSYWEDYRPFFVELGVQRQQAWLHPRRRNVHDLIIGQQDFSYGEYGHDGGVTIQMGRVVYSWTPTY